MLKVVELIPSLEKKGGAEVLVVNLLVQMAKNNDAEIFLICLYDGIDPDFQRIINNCKNIKVFFCSKKKGIDLKSAKKLRSIIKSIKPNVIHMHLSCLVTLFFAFPFGNKKIKFFQTIHSVPREDSKGVKNVLRKFYCKHRNLVLVGISDSITKEAIRAFRFLKYEKNIYTVNNGFNNHPVQKCVKKVNDLICVASIKPVKNQKMLLDCLTALLPKYPNIKVAMLGDGEQFDEMISYCGSLGLDKNVTFYGSVDNVSDYLNLSKIFVLTSKYEGNPISVLEALGLGLPCVVPRVGGIPDIVTNDVNGFLFEVANNEEFVSYIDKLLSDSVLYNKMSENAKESVSKYTIENCASEYIKIFKEKCDEN